MVVSCKDCVHVDVCEDITRHKLSPSRAEKILPILRERGKTCELFKDRSRFVELSHAEWVEDEDMYGDPIYHCSNCNEHFVLEEGTPTDNCYFYCPNCGAKMDEQALKEREENA